MIDEPGGMRIPIGLARAYVAARFVVAASLLLLFVTDILEPDPTYAGLVYFGILAFALVGVVLLFLQVLANHGTARGRRTLLVILPFDMIATGMLLLATHRYEDPMYTWLVGVGVVYALALPKREAIASAVFVAVSYLLLHYIGFSAEHTVGDYVLLAFKASALVFVGYFVTEGMHMQLKREAQLEDSHDSIESLNQQLQRRLAELNAVSEITEVIHSSLDFDSIGTLVLDIIQKVIDVPACSLLVLDKQKAETLFSASAGLAESATSRTLDRVVDAGEGTVELESGLFSCLTILDHGQMMVVFCAEAEQVERMRVEDRLVLQAVASELAVAVENSQLYKLTKRLSITDELTGLNNYRYLQQRLEDEFERARRYERPLSMLMIDADDFKLFNDSYGHVAGDQALGELGQLIKRCVREIDVAARYGGEEFSVVLPETDSAGAFVVAEKIREAIAEHRFADGEGERVVELTVSIGLATFPMHAEDREGLMRQADDALYTAKHLGRDRVRAAEPLRRLGEDEVEGRPA